MNRMLAFALSAATMLGQPETQAQQLGRDYFVSGDTVAVHRATTGDLFAAGREVSVDGVTAGDAVLAGYSIDIESRVEQNVYAAGRQVRLNGTVGSGARLAGSEIEVGPGAQVRNVLAAGNTIRVEGTVSGYVRAMGSEVYLNGPVDGDVEVTASRVRLGPQARISGTLRYRSPNALERDPAAVVNGPVQQSAVRPSRGMAALFWMWTLGLALAIGVLIAVFPRLFAAAADAMEHRMGRSVLLGIAVLVAVPIFAGLLLITGIGAPLALLTLATYFVMVLAGYLTAAAALGQMALERFSPRRAGARLWRIAAAALSIVVLGVVASIPVIGWLVGFAALLFGVGALTLAMRNRLAVTGRPAAL